MLRFLLIVALLISSVTPGFAQIENPQRYTIRYVDKVRSGSPNFENQQLPAKARRLSSNKGNINIIYNDVSIPDSIKTSIAVAVNLWEAKISNKQPIYIDIEFEPLYSEVPMICGVYYQEYDISDNGSYGIPIALLSQIDNFPNGSELEPDGIIYFNSDIKWSCSFSSDNSTDYNMTTMALRGIAHCLGFGSDVIEYDTDKYLYEAYNPSIFNQYLYCDTIRLADLEDQTDELASFVKSDNVFFKTVNNSYKMYCPTEFEQYISLRYFEDDNSLMSYSLGKGNCLLAIDEKTLDVLKTIGWDLPQSGLRIKSTDISDDGIASSYISHTFYIDKGNKTLSNYQWKFMIKNKSGEFELISSGSEETFTINKIKSPNDYYINVNGDLEGRIECSYSIEGVEERAIPFSVSMELAPSIISIDNIEKHYTTDYGFYLTFTVKYTGAAHLTASVEEEYSYGERVYWCYEPYIGHVTTGIISNLFYSWVTVEVENEYGRAVKTLEFEPEYDNYNLARRLSQSSNVYPLIEEINRIQVFSLDGILKYEGSPENYSDSQLSPGIYLKRDIQNDRVVRNSKVIVR